MDRRKFLELTSTVALSGVLASCIDGQKQMITPLNSKERFLTFLATIEVNPRAALAEEVLDSVLQFYSEPVSGLTSDANSDMLLYEWGVFAENGVEYFSFDITRQFIEAGKEGDDAFSMLGFQSYYAASHQLREIGEGNKWCESKSLKEDFYNFIVASPAYHEVESIRPVRSALFWERA